MLCLFQEGITLEFLELCEDDTDPVALSNVTTQAHPADNMVSE